MNFQKSVKVRFVEDLKGSDHFENGTYGTGFKVVV
jgi:hypothetical protein